MPEFGSLIASSAEKDEFDKFLDIARIPKLVDVAISKHADGHDVRLVGRDGVVGRIADCDGVGTFDLSLLSATSKMSCASLYR